jgi:hypothetical protein
VTHPNAREELKGKPKGLHETRAQRFGDDHHMQLANGASLERFNRLRGEADRSAAGPGPCKESAGVEPVLLS